MEGVVIPPARVIKQWVKPFYMDVLGGNMTRLTGRERDRFLRDTRRAVAKLDDDIVATLLGGEWRSRISAAWFIGVGQRAEYIDQLGPLLVDSQLTYQGQGLCFAMAANPSAESATWLVRYLDRWLPRTDCYYDQTWAMGALLIVDREMQTDVAEQYLGSDAAWDRWLGAETTSPAGAPLPSRASRGFSPQVETIDAMLAIAAECRL